jgi:hypothetical protein
VSNEFDISEEPAGYQLDEVLSPEFMDDAYRDYRIQPHNRDLLEIWFTMNPYKHEDKFERPHLCHTEYRENR